MLHENRRSEFKARLGGAGITQAQLAIAMGYTQGQVSNWLGGRNWMSPELTQLMDDTIKRLVRAETAANKARKRVLSETE